MSDFSEVPTSFTVGFLNEPGVLDGLNVSAEERAKIVAATERERFEVEAAAQALAQERAARQFLRDQRGGGRTLAEIATGLPAGSDPGLPLQKLERDRRRELAAEKRLEQQQAALENRPLRRPSRPDMAKVKEAEEKFMASPASMADLAHAETKISWLEKTVGKLLGRK